MANAPILFNDSRELIEEVLQRLAEGETLLEICRDIAANDPQYPQLIPRVIRSWSRDYEDFGRQYDQALIDGAEALADQMHRIAETPSKTEIITERWSGGKKPKLLERQVRIVDNLERDKLRILVRQYRSRMQSSKVRFAEKPQLGLSGSGDGEPITVEIRGGLPSRPQDGNNAIPVAQLENPAT